MNPGTKLALCQLLCLAALAGFAFISDRNAPDALRIKALADYIERFNMTRFRFVHLRRIQLEMAQLCGIMRKYLTQCKPILTAAYPPLI